METKAYKMNEKLHNAMKYKSPTYSDEIVTRYSRLWWDNVAHKCDNCKYFDKHDACHKKGTFGAVENESLYKCGNYTDDEITENLQMIEDIIIEEFPEELKNNYYKLSFNMPEIKFGNEYGYHTRKIEKGELGEFSKIKEEFEELEDAINQEDPVMALCECSDLLGAIEAFTKSKYNITLKDLISFNLKTQNAFKIGKR